jgi:hypothetical protein
MGKGSSGTKTTYTASPEQRGLYKALLPMIQGMAGAGTAQLGQTGYGMPQAPTMPSMQGVMSGVSPYQIGGYNVPSTSGIMPTKDWFGSLAPEVKQGVWAPYEDAANQLGERMGSQGMLGNARGGYSGAAGSAFGEFYSDAGKDYGTQLWNMSAPGAMAGWQGQLGQNQYMAGLQNQQNMLGYNNLVQERTMDYNNQMNQANQNYQGQMNAWALPWGLTGMMPSTFSQGITTQPQNNMMGALGGAGAGAATGAMVGSIFPGLGTGLGALLGGGAGLFGGLFG